MSGLIAFICH